MSNLLSIDFCFSSKICPVLFGHIAGRCFLLEDKSWYAVPSILRHCLLVVCTVGIMRSEFFWYQMMHTYLLKDCSPWYWAEVSRVDYLKNLMLKVLIYQGYFHACNIIVLHSLCLSVCLSVSLFVCLFVCLSVYLSVCLSFSHIQLVWSSTFHVIIICLFLFMFIGT